MKISSWKTIQSIKRHGWFCNCNYLPSKLSSVDLYEHYKLYDKYFKRVPKYIGQQKHLEFNTDCDFIALDQFPGFAYSCNLEHCNPSPITAVKAKKQALYARKYGYITYIRRFMFKKNQKMQLAKYAKFANSWDNFGLK
jgi:hypothetical protein